MEKVVHASGNMVFFVLSTDLRRTRDFSIATVKNDAWNIVLEGLYDRLGMKMRNYSCTSTLNHANSSHRCGFKIMDSLYRHSDVFPSLV